MEKKKISVLMTVYKENEEELKESFESIINQTYKNLEIIIVIDSPDESWRKEFIEQYNDTSAWLNVMLRSRSADSGEVKFLCR